MSQAPSPQDEANRLLVEYTKGAVQYFKRHRDLVRALEDDRVGTEDVDRMAHDLYAFVSELKRTKVRLREVRRKIVNNGS